MCRATQTYTTYRENQRFHLEYLTSYVRSLVLEQGPRLTGRGALAEVFDVFFLTGDELWAAMDGNPLPGTTERLRGTSSDDLSGLGASRGTVRGSTRVMFGLADLADLEPGASRSHKAAPAPNTRRASGLPTRSAT